MCYVNIYCLHGGYNFSLLYDKFEVKYFVFVKRLILALNLGGHKATAQVYEKVLPSYSFGYMTML